MSPFQARAVVEDVLADLLQALRHRGDRLLDVQEVMVRTTLSRNTIAELEHAGAFPRRRRVTPNRVAWLESEIDEWIASRPAEEDVREGRG
jgi:prophage regulatory protein